jgi:hypothetical protein
MLSGKRLFLTMPKKRLNTPAKIPEHKLQTIQPDLFLLMLNPKAPMNGL